MGDEPDLDTRLHGTAEQSDRPVAGRQLGEVVATDEVGGGRFAALVAGAAGGRGGRRGLRAGPADPAGRAVLTGTSDRIEESGSEQR
jgi:hypothetical protein